jgi:DNA invertase Pin-like site-specific DNA recombinase
LGLKGLIAELELHRIKTRLDAGLISKASRGDLGMSLPVGLVHGHSGRVVKHLTLPTAHLMKPVILCFFRDAAS